MNCEPNIPPSQTPPLAKVGFGFSSLLIWLGIVFCGFATLVLHDMQAFGRTAESSTPRRISKELSQSLDLSTEHLNLVVALHPMCPCTLNTLAELERLQAIARDEHRIIFLVFRGESGIDGWNDTPVLRFASRLRLSRFIPDPNAELTSSLEIEASGGVVALDHDGTMRFRGGITSGRSCSVDNPGSAAVASLLHGESIEGRLETPVFGCPFRSES